jgi:mannose/fructose/N-acetylgalactosamine-specific phosphotransferase system component IIB
MSDEMKQDIEKLKKDMADVRATERSIAVALTRIEGKVDVIVDDMATKTQVGLLINQVDDFCGIVEASRGERKLVDESFSGIREILQDHEARLIRPEPRKKS